MVQFISKKNSEMIAGMALNLEKDQVGIIIFGDDHLISQGDQVVSFGRLVSVNTGYHHVGRVVNALGDYIDHEPEKTFVTILEQEDSSDDITSQTLNIERKAPGVITRESVTERC